MGCGPGRPAQRSPGQCPKVVLLFEKYIRLPEPKIVLTRPNWNSCLGALALAVAPAANAAELCVKCTEPDASYACVIGGADYTTVDTITKLYCITALAKVGPHASCAVDRNSSPPCQGERREFPIPAGFGGLTTDHPAQQDAAAPPGSVPGQDAGASEHGLPANGTAMQPGDPEAGRLRAPTNGEVAGQPSQHDAAADTPPKTVQEMVEKSAKQAGDSLADTGKTAGDAAKSAGSALGKAGNAVGTAAKNSWKCLSSFFSNC